MKYFLSASSVLALLFLSLSSIAQVDQPKPSPLDSVMQKVGKLEVKIVYSAPSVKGRTIGKDLEPMQGKVWRTGANEATVFEVDRDVKIDGKDLKKGKYGLFTIDEGSEFVVIFNKTWKQWGAFKYQESEDALRVKVKKGKANPFAEKMTFKIDDKGLVTLLWGDMMVDFKVKDRLL
jgi:hypothetical protein